MKQFSSLRSRLFVVISVCFILILTWSYFTVNSTLVNANNHLEYEKNRLNIERILSFFNNNLEQFSSVAEDYAHWDDTYEYLKVQNGQYIQSNFANETFARLKLNHVFILNNQFKILYKKSYDLQLGQPIETPINILNFFQDFRQLDNLFDLSNEKKSGIVVINDMPIMIVITPILPTNQQGIHRGYLVFAKELNSTWNKEFKDKTKQNVDLFLFKQNQAVSSDLFIAKKYLLENNTTSFYNVLNIKLSYNFTYLEDLYGNPAVLLRITSDRETYLKIKEFIDQFANGILCILLAIATIAFLFDRIVLRRLEILNDSLLNICDKEHFNQPIFQDTQNSKTKEDEINQLSQSVNILLKKIYFAQRELENNNNYLEEYVAKRTHELLVLRSRAEESNLIKAQFLANISHEIRTPINGIMGMSYLLRDTHLDEEQKEFLDTIEQSSNDLLKMVNNILDFSSFDLEQKTNQESYTSFNIKELIEIIINEFHQDVAEKNVVISYEILRTIPNEIISNNNHLRVILKNLVSNAVKFTDQGYIYIRIEFYKNNDHNLANESQENTLSWLSISVKDSGIGISEEQHKTIFDPFNRTHQSLMRKYDGIGLGLAIVKKLVEYEGGQIWVESEEHNGCQFNFTFPCLFK